MKECQVPETRRTLKIAFDKRCVDVNTKIFEEILDLRTQVRKELRITMIRLQIILNHYSIIILLNDNQLAAILGFKNFSEYQLSMRCAKNPETVATFLKRLSEKLIVLQKKEMETLLEYKKNHVSSLLIILKLQWLLYINSDEYIKSVKNWR